MVKEDEKEIFANVAIPKAGGRVFDYCAQGIQIHEGAIVEVPFGKQSTYGIVIAISSKSMVKRKQLKPLLNVLPSPYHAMPFQLDLFKWMSSYYHVALGRLISSCIPLSTLGKSTQDVYYGFYQCVDVNEHKLTAQQNACWQWLQKQVMPCSYHDLLQAPFKITTIHALIDRNLLVKAEVIPQPIELSSQQQQAYEQIKSSTQCTLLFGVTGSGKTQIYLRLIKDTIQQGNQALLLVPEIGLTPQTLAKAVNHLGTGVVSWHSRLSAPQRSKIWELVASGDAKVIIGTRSALFLPFKSLQQIIIDEEHDLSFYQQSHPTFSARDIAVVLAKKLEASILLGSATPSLESWKNANDNRYQIVKLDQAFHAHAHHWEVVDLRKQHLTGGIAKVILDRVRRVMESGQQVLFFLNRRGYNPVTLCHGCGATVKCRSCDVKLNYSKTMNRMRCHLCDATYPVPTECLECKSDELIHAGIGTEKLAETLTQIFPEYPVIRMDSDTMQNAKNWSQIKEQISENKPMLLVGTQMVAKGHNFLGLSDVVIMDTDHALYATDYRALERWGQTVLQVAGRCGRAGQEGRVWIQTHIPHHPAVSLMTQKVYFDFLKHTQQYRKEGLWPPFSYVAKINYQHQIQTKLKDYLGHMCMLLTDIIEVIGPVIPAIKKKKGWYQGYLLLRTQDRDQLFKACQLMSQYEVAVEVDPQELDN